MPFRSQWPSTNSAPTAVEDDDAGARLLKVRSLDRSALERWVGGDGQGIARRGLRLRLKSPLGRDADVGDRPWTWAHVADGNDRRVPDH